MKFIFLLFSLSLSIIASANALTIKPEKCPGVGAIAAVGVDSVGQGTHEWMAFPSNPSNYDTNQPWSFGIFVHANSREEALAIARMNLPLISYGDGPYHDDNDPSTMWTCQYGNRDSIAYAFSLPNWHGNFMYKALR